LFGAKPNSIDAGIYGFTAKIYFYEIDTPLREFLVSQPNVVLHCQSVHARCTGMSLDQFARRRRRQSACADSEDRPLRSEGLLPHIVNDPTSRSALPSCLPQTVEHVFVVLRTVPWNTLEHV
jgi:Glutathione S-transferase, C-terminal domain